MKKIIAISLAILLLVSILPAYVNAEADTTIKIKYYNDTYELKVDVLKLADLFSDFEESYPEENNKITVKVNQAELKTDINGLKILLGETNTKESKEIWKEISKKQSKRDFYRMLSSFILITFPPQILEIQ
jgi:hypothetical protein